MEEGNNAVVGFAGQQYDPKKHRETFRSTVRAYLCDGTTAVASDIVQDGEDHIHPEHFKDHIPKTNPYDVALRCDKGNVPQIQFNDDGVWHDFAPEGMITLHAGFLYWGCPMVTA